MIGLIFGGGARGAKRPGAGGVNPAGLGPTALYLPGNYVAGDWTPTSAGAHLLEGTSQPDVASGDPDFVPANNDQLSSTNALSDLFGPGGGGEFVAVVDLDAIVTTTPAHVYAGDGVWVDTAGYAGLFFWKDGASPAHYWASWYQYDTGDKSADLDLGTTVPTGPQLFQGWKTGGNLYLSWNGAAPVSVACGGIGSAAGTLRLGKNSYGPALDGRVRCLGFYAAALSTPDRDGLHAWAQSTLGVP